MERGNPYEIFVAPSSVGDGEEIHVITQEDGEVQACTYEGLKEIYEKWGGSHILEASDKVGSGSLYL